MPFNLFSGKIEGHSFVAAQTLIPAEQQRAGMAVDILTPLPGSRVPKFTENGWLLRTVAPDISPEVTYAVAKSAGGEMIEVGEVKREEVAKFISPKVLERVLEPHHLEPEVAPEQ